MIGLRNGFTTFLVTHSTYKCTGDHLSSDGRIQLARQ